MGEEHTGRRIKTGNIRCDKTGRKWNGRKEGRKRKCKAAEEEENERL